MKIDNILNISNLSPEFKKDIQSFLSLCKQLDRLTGEENDILLSEPLSLNALSAEKKIILLERFEEKIPLIFKEVQKKAPHNLALQSYLLEQVQDFQKKLKINTNLHLHMMRVHPETGGGYHIICH